MENSIKTRILLKEIHIAFDIICRFHGPLKMILVFEKFSPRRFYLNRFMHKNVGDVILQGL